jgi:hypothetical protein
MDFGIPFGDFFTGAEGIKTEEEAEIYGGRLEYNMVPATIWPATPLKTSP